MSIGWILLQIGLNGFDAAYVMSLSTNKKDFKPWVKTPHIILYWLALVVVFCAINFLTSFSLISIVVFPLLATIYPVLFHANNVFKYAFYALFFYTLLICIEMAFTWLLMLFHQISFEELLASSSYTLQAITGSKILVTIAWIFFFTMNKKMEKSPQDIFRRYVIISICAFFMSLFSMIGEETFHRFSYQMILSTLFLVFIMGTFVLTRDMYQKRQQVKQLYAQLEIDYKEKIVRSYQASTNFYNKIIEDQRKIWETMLEFRNNSSEAIMKSSQAMRLANERLNRQQCTSNSLVDTVIMIRDYEISMDEIVLKVEGELKPTYIPEVSMIVDQLLLKAFDEVREIEKNDYMFPYFITIRFEYFNDEKSLAIEIEYPSRSIAPLPLDSEIKYLIEQLDGNVTSSGWRSDSEGDYQATRVQLNQCQLDII